jgi:hypothetical protein
MEKPGAHAPRAENHGGRMPKFGRNSRMMTLRPSKLGPPVYAHLVDYEMMDDGQPIGRIMEEREPTPDRGWS